MGAMTDQTRDNLRAAVQRAYDNLQKAKTALVEASQRGYASVSISSTSGSKSYSNYSPDALRSLVDELALEYQRLYILYRRGLPWPLVSRIETIRG